MDKRMVEVCVRIIRETDYAVLVGDGGKEVWLPKSQIEENVDGEEDECLTLTLPEWLALKSGLI